MPIPIYGIPPFIKNLKIQGKINDTLLKIQENTNSAYKPGNETELLTDSICDCCGDDIDSKEELCAEKYIEG